MRQSKGGVIPPTPEQLKKIAEEYHFQLTDEETEIFCNLIEGTFPSYRRVGELPEPNLPVKYPRTPGYRPPPEENSLNAWYWKTEIKGVGEGKLAGKKIVLKDPVSVAGVPTMAGSAILEGFIPDADATVVTRILDAGGEIVGKAVCEDLCISGGSITSCPVPVRNPHNPQYSAGGSSGGCAVLVVSGDCDMAIGADQGGSIRIPSALCGAVGLKPTYGLVPYTGIFPIENSIDHAGPICLTVEDAALLLEVIAGKDGLDPRQYAELQPEEYTQTMKGSVKGLKVGVLKEGFNWDGSGKETEEAVRDAAFALGKAGAKVKEISVPLHRDGIHIFTPIIMEGAAMQMVRLNGFGVGWKGHYSTNAQTFYGKARKARADSYSLLTKMLILCGHYMYDEYQGHYYAKAQNQTRTLTEEYNKALKEVDVLAMPTTAPQGEAVKIIEGPSLEELIAQTFMYHYNTCPFDATGHPALSVPCAKYNGLPVGLMLIGRHFEESTVLKAAHAFQDMGLYQ